MGQTIKLLIVNGVTYEYDLTHEGPPTLESVKALLAPHGVTWHEGYRAQVIEVPVRNKWKIA